MNMCTQPRPSHQTVRASHQIVSACWLKQPVHRNRLHTMAPKSSMKRKSRLVTKPVPVTPSVPPVPSSKASKFATRTRSGAVAWHSDGLAKILEDIRNRPDADSFESIGKVVCFDKLPHGPHAEVNVFGHGNNCFRVVPDFKCLEPRGVYKFHVRYDVEDDDEPIDEFTIGTISSVRYLGTAKSISDASGRMTPNVSRAVAEMLRYNTDADVDTVCAVPI